MNQRRFHQGELAWIANKLESEACLRWSDLPHHAGSVLDDLEKSIEQAIKRGESFFSIAYRLTYHGLYVSESTLRMHFGYLARANTALSKLLPF